jgi:hypothetical protein
MIGGFTVSFCMDRSFQPGLSTKKKHNRVQWRSSKFLVVLDVGELMYLFLPGTCVCTIVQGARTEWQNYTLELALQSTRAIMGTPVTGKKVP